MSAEANAGAGAGSGRLTGVGVGPGDPDLLTIRAARIITAADVIAYHCARHGRSIARAAAEPYLRDGQVEEILRYPVTTEGTDHPGGYNGVLADFYVEAAARLERYLLDGRDVVVLCEGDPSLYGSYLHLHKRLSGRFAASIVPGISSVSAAAAASSVPLVQHDETLVVLPGTLPGGRAPGPAGRGRRGGGAQARPDVRQGPGRARRGRAARPGPLRRAGGNRLRAGRAAGRRGPGRRPATCPWRWSRDTAVVGRRRGRDRRHGHGRGHRNRSRPGPRGDRCRAGTGRPGLAHPGGRRGARGRHRPGRLPALPGPHPGPAGQQRHASGNTVEADRAAFALDLAAAGRRVAVVSSGDPGVFAMATAVLEQAGDERWDGVPVTVLPGVTAAQAVAARAGAPLGHDYCVISLSDRLKPWEVIADRVGHAAAADFVLALYNPASRSRTWQLAAVSELLLRHRAPDTPVVVGRAVGRADEQLAVITLAELADASIDMSTLVIVGSSATGCTIGPVARWCSLPGITEKQAKQPALGLVDGSAPRHVRPRRPTDHHHREGKLAGGGELALGQRAATVLGDEHVDPMPAHEIELGRRVVRASGQDDLVRRRQRTGRRVHAADQEPRPIEGRERGQPLPPGGQKGPPPERWQQPRGLRQRGNVMPGVPLTGRPGPAAPG